MLKNFFNVKIEQVKEGRKGYLRKGNETPLELTPNWNSIDHDELYGIDQAQLTLADVNVNRDGDYISKLFFINRNDKMESIIFTIFQEEVDSSGKIIEAKMFFNELNGDFIDGYRIEDGKITKKIIVVKKPNVQKASMFMFFQEKEYWTTDCLGGGGTNEIIVKATPFPGIRPGPTSHGIGGFTNINVYSTGNPSTSSNYTSGGGVSGRTTVTSVAGSLYTHAINERELAEGEEEQIINELKGKEKCAYEQMTSLNLFKSTINRFGHNDNYNLILKSWTKDACNSSYDDGCTDASDLKNGNITIYIQNPGRGSLDVAAIILHEGIHAEIFKYVDEYKKGLDPNNREKLLEWYFTYKAQNDNTYATSDAQHQYMADNFVKPIAEALRELDNYKYPLNDYMGFAWEGLRPYGYDGYRDNGKWVTLDKNQYIGNINKVLDNTDFNKNCN